MKHIKDYLELLPLIGLMVLLSLGLGYCQHILVEEPYENAYADGYERGYSDGWSDGYADAS